MQLSETENCYEVYVKAELLEDDTPVITLASREYNFGFDKQQAVEFLPILENFIKTGELPK